MARQPNHSKQTEGLLLVLLQAPEEWRYGYDLSRETHLKSGSLYPILMRFEGLGWLEARWSEELAPGKPRRHLYRLTAKGLTDARAMLERPKRSSRTAGLEPSLGTA